MDGVTLGAGDLGGSGVYATRDFAAGEEVLTYRLRPIDLDEYRALAEGEDLFVHSFGGRRFLYPAPARFVNHSADPSCIQDFDHCRHLALRPIAKGEMITTDAHQETARELDTFLDAYRDAIAERSAPLLAALVDTDATLWLPQREVHGRDAVITALLDDEPMPSPDVEWHVGTGRWEALCSVETETAAGRRHLTMLIKVLEGNWQLIYLHAG